MADEFSRSQPDGYSDLGRQEGRLEQQTVHNKLEKKSQEDILLISHHQLARQEERDFSYSSERDRHLLLHETLARVQVLSHDCKRLAAENRDLRTELETLKWDSEQVQQSVTSLVLTRKQKSLRFRMLFDFCLLREFTRDKERGRSCYKREGTYYSEIAFPHEMLVLLLLLGRYPRIVALGLKLFSSMRIIWRNSIYVSPDHRLTSLYDSLLGVHLLDSDLVAPSEECFNMRWGQRSGSSREEQRVLIPDEDCPLKWSSFTVDSAFLGAIGYVDCLRENRKDECVLENQKSVDLPSLRVWLKGALQTGQIDPFVVGLRSLLSARVEERYSEIDKVLHSVIACLKPRYEVEDYWSPLYNLPLHDGTTVVYLAAELGQAEVVEVLHSLGADVNKADKDGWTPVHIAAHSGHVEVVKVLLSAGADANTDNDGWTPVAGAARQGQVEVVKVLCSLGANFSVADRFPPQHAAAYNGYLEIVKTLHSFGADFTVQDVNGSTPIQLARENDHTEVVSYLQSLTGEQIQSKLWLHKLHMPLTFCFVCLFRFNVFYPEVEEERERVCARHGQCTL